MQGTQTQMKFVPEQTTDFIFALLVKNGALSVLCCDSSLFILLHIIILAERQRSIFLEYMAMPYINFFTHIVINIGMTVGLIPVIGIPLPFLSYGGSSYWAFTLLLATFINLDMYHNEIV